MEQEITKVSELDPQNEYKGVMIYIYSEQIESLQKIKEKILQRDEKCSAAFGERKYYESRPMLVIEGDFPSEHLKDIIDYLSGQNVAFATVNESGILKISNRPTKSNVNDGPDQGIIPDTLDEIDLEGMEG